MDERRNFRLKLAIAMNNRVEMDRIFIEELREQLYFEGDTVKGGRIHFSSAKDDWGTPLDLYARLHKEFNFTLDPCTTSDNPLKTPRFYTKEDDGLKQDWKGERVYCNPPYSTSKDWIEKAHLSVLNEGSVVVMLLPARTDTLAFHAWIYPFCGTFENADMAWAAGIVDGEGCIFVRRNRPTARGRQKSIIYDLGIKVSMTHAATIERMAEIFGVGHITPYTVEGYRPAWSWVCRSENASMVLRSIYPYLLTKRRQAYWGIRFNMLGKFRGERKIPVDVAVQRESLYTKLRVLKNEDTGGLVSTEIRFLPGRLTFRCAKWPAPFPSMLVIYRGGR